MGLLNMSFYRIYNYPLKVKKFRHVHIKRKRGGVQKEVVGEKSSTILDELAILEKSSQNLSRARRAVRDIILCNHFDYFCTFTFNAEKVDRYDFKSCKKKITQLFMNYKQRYSPDFRYIVIPEFHKDGAVHFHGMVKGIRPEDFTIPEYILKRDHITDQVLVVPNTKAYVDWQYYSSKLGYFSCSAVKEYEACAQYVSKYITKALMSLPLGQRVFMASAGLERPELIFDQDDVHMTVKPDYENDFVSVKDSEHSFGFIEEWYGECCSDLNDIGSQYELEEEIFQRLTGEQLGLYNEEEVI